jgi:hypothetical protein
MSNLTQFVADGKPIKITRLAIGVGFFSPLFANSFCTWVMGGGAGGGARPSHSNSFMAGGGGAGAEGSFAAIITGPWAFSIGEGGVGGAADGVAGGDGSPTIFGAYRVMGGKGGTPSGSGGLGGLMPTGASGLQGANGGAGANGAATSGQSGGAPGYGAGTGAGLGGATPRSGGGGGDSSQGAGGSGGAGSTIGVATSPTAGTAASAGGGGGADGQSVSTNGASGGRGFIEVSEFGPVAVDTITAPAPPPPPPAPAALVFALDDTVQVGSAAAGSLTNLGATATTFSIVSTPTSTVSPASGSIGAGAVVPLTVTPPNDNGGNPYSVAATNTGTGTMTGSPQSLVASAAPPPPPPPPGPGGVLWQDSFVIPGATASTAIETYNNAYIFATGDQGAGYLGIPSDGTNGAGLRAIFSGVGNLTTYRRGPSHSANCYIKAIFGGLSFSAGEFVMCLFVNAGVQATHSCYRLRVIDNGNNGASHQFKLQKVVNDTVADMATFSAVLSDGDTVTLEALTTTPGGTPTITLTAKVGASSIGSFADNTALLSIGQGGFGARQSTASKITYAEVGNV